MIRITQTQREKVGNPAFVDRIAFHIRRYRPEDIHGIPEAVLRRRIEHGVEKGRSYGLTWEYSLTVFVAHMIGINPAFDEQPAVHRGLLNPELPPDERIDALIAAVSDEEWEEAGRRCNPAAYWQPIDATVKTGEN